jgi:hypothetical protein
VNNPALNASFTCALPYNGTRVGVAIWEGTLKCPTAVSRIPLGAELTDEQRAEIASKDLETLRAESVQLQNELARTVTELEIILAATADCDIDESVCDNAGVTAVKTSKEAAYAAAMAKQKEVQIKIGEGSAGEHVPGDEDTWRHPRAPPHESPPPPLPSPPPSPAILMYDLRNSS